mgnify:CR=1 FL=1
MRLMKDGRNMMTDGGCISDTARRAIAGLMELAPAITAFGNTTPTSYFRLVPHQEAPTNVCWGDRNRSVLVRVRLGWSALTDMSAVANPLEAPVQLDTTQKQTVEIRSADGSADVYLLLAALAVACRHGFELADAPAIAERTYVNVNIHKDENRDRLALLAQLPDSCAASAKALAANREAFEEKGVFSPRMIDGIISKLEGYHDEDLRQKTEGDHNAMMKLVHKYWHCG